MIFALDATPDVVVVATASNVSVQVEAIEEFAALAAESSEAQRYLVPPNITRTGQPRDGPKQHNHNPYSIASAMGAQAGGACKLCIAPRHGERRLA